MSTGSSCPSGYNPKSTSLSKIPLFDEANFSMWKSKALMVLETMDYSMMEIITNGPHCPMYQPTKDGVAIGESKPTPKHEYSAEDKHLCSLDVKARAAIGNALPYNIYHLIQNCESTKEMMDTLTVAYEGTEEVRATNVNNLNRKYEHFFALKNETLTETFNRFNCLINDMRKLSVMKHKSALVLKFLDSLGEQWEHHADVLKNSGKIESMDLQTLFGNLRNYEETKALRKEIMRDNRQDKSVALYSKRPSTDSDTEKSSLDDSDEEYKKRIASSAALIVKHFSKRDERSSGSKRFSTSSGSRRFDADKNGGSEKMNDGKCFNCGSPDHFARDCSAKKNSTSEESYEAKYKKLVESLKKQNIDVKVLLAEEEKWVEEEESSDDEEKKDACLVAVVGGASTFDADLAQAAKDSNMRNWDSSSVYKVSKFINYTLTEQENMFQYLSHDLSKSNQEK